jgi:hypothetical protein
MISDKILYGVAVTKSSQGTSQANAICSMGEKFRIDIKFPFTLVANTTHRRTCVFRDFLYIRLSCSITSMVTSESSKPVLVYCRAYKTCSKYADP